jgi:hypothetical protein
MKKATKIGKLALSKETLRQLDPQDTEQATGGFLSWNYISCIGCQTTKTC